ncbi:MAG: FliM/FliN family flagellar motor switch protein [Armatimonadota bacterium]
MTDYKKKSRQKSVSSYDLRQTVKFTFDQQDFLRKIFEIFSDKFSVNVSSLIHGKVSMKLKQVRVSSHRAYFNSLSDPSNMIEFKIDPETKGLIFMDFALSFALIDRLMGGRGQTIDEIRYFTEIESAVLKTAYNKVMESYNTAWKDVVEVNAQFAGTEFNPQVVHIADPGEHLVIASFEATIVKTTGVVELCMPYSYLKKILPKESFDEYLLTKTSVKDESQTSIPMFAKNLEVAKVPLVVELGRVEVFFQDILQVEPGDIIKLEQELGSDMRIKVNDKTKFLGRPGLREDGVAVQVTKVLTEEDEEFEE